MNEQRGQQISKPEKESVRCTFSLVREERDELDQIAADRRVTRSWLLREILRKYLAEQHPLFDNRNKGGMDARTASSKSK